MNYILGYVGIVNLTFDFSKTSETKLSEQMRDQQV